MPQPTFIMWSTFHGAQFAIGCYFEGPTRDSVMDQWGAKINNLRTFYGSAFYSICGPIREVNANL
jgi:hypothetical protein